VVSPPSVTQTHTDINVTVTAPPPDPKAIADAATESAPPAVQAIIVQLVAPTLANWATDALGVSDIIKTTPPGLTYNQSGVRSLAETVRNVGLALVALAIFGVGISAALHGERPAVGRLLWGAVLCLGNLTWWQWGIDLNNAISQGISAPAIASIVKPHLSLPSTTANPAEAFGPAVLTIVYAVVALLLLISMAFRLGMLDVLIVLGPIALLCVTTEQSNRFAQTYTGLAVGTLFSQIPVVVALSLAPVIGGLGGGIAGTILGVVVLLLARQMPSLLANRLSSGSGGSGAVKVGLVALRRAIARA
jgi:hypothetical protein